MCDSALKHNLHIFWLLDTNIEIEKKQRKCAVIFRKWLMCCTIYAKFHLGMVLTLCGVKLRRRQETNVSLLPSARKWRGMVKWIHLYFYLMREFFSKIDFCTFIDFLYIKSAWKFAYVQNLFQLDLFVLSRYFYYLFDSLKYEDVSSVNSVKPEFLLNSINLKK